MSAESPGEGNESDRIIRDSATVGTMRFGQWILVKYFRLDSVSVYIISVKLQQMRYSLCWNERA